MQSYRMELGSSPPVSSQPADFTLKKAEGKPSVSGALSFLHKPSRGDAGLFLGFILIRFLRDALLEPYARVCAVFLAHSRRAEPRSGASGS